MRSLSRRSAFRLMGAVAAGVMAPPIMACHPRQALGLPGRGVGFGPLKPKIPENSDELGITVVGDLRGVPLLDLPDGFRYKAFSITGQTMNDGGLVPGNHDGMGCFAGQDGRMILVRNHELLPGENKFGSKAGVAAPADRKWDAAATGGATTLAVAPDGSLVKHFGTLAGTIRNCAGGPTPWGSWISCEENVDVPDAVNGLLRKHGYNFEVPATATGFVDPVPLFAMGRFRHEAVAVDPRSGFLYQTEDREDGALYRFRPKRRGVLREGGALEAMVIDDPRLQSDASGSASTRQGMRGLLGAPLRVRWILIEEPDPMEDTVRYEALVKGAARFSRGEGAWYGNGRVYFVCTTGGDAGKGQVWAFDPKSETVTLIVESAGGADFDNPDNVTVAADGSLYMCEDSPGQQFIVGISPSGRLFRFARNAVIRPDRGGKPGNSEFTGACFSPDGRWLFVNNYGVGITFGIRGPWERLARG
jgi:secreted PhoX family phosphatase